MTQKSFIISISLLVLLVGGYFLFVSYSKNLEKGETWGYIEEKKIPSYDEMKKAQQESIEKDAEIYNKAIKSQNESLCDTIIQSSEKSRCHDMIGLSRALKEGKQEQCDALSSSGIIERCHDNIAFAQAENSLDAQVCQTIFDENLRTQCHASIDEKTLALRTNSGTIDALFCETLGGEMRDRCRARIDRSQDNISYKEALSTKTLSDCDSITDDTLKAQCRDTILFDRAIREKDNTLCESIIDIERMNYCQKSLSTRVDATNYQSIVAKGDIRECAQLESITLNHQCHDVIIIAEVRTNQDKTLCDNLYNTGLIMNCQALIRER